MENDITFMILKIVLSVIFALISTYAIPALKAYTNEHKNSQLYSMIETAVRAAEQTISDSGAGREKKDMVLEKLEAWICTKGINVSKEELDLMIEEYVYLLNNPSKE